MDNQAGSRKSKQYLSKRKLLYYLVLICFLTGLLLAFINYRFGSIQKVKILLGMSAFSIIPGILVKFNFQRLGIFLLIFLVATVIVLLMIQNGGMADPSVMSFPVILFISSLLIGKRSVVFLMILILAAGNILGILEMTGIIEIDEPVMPGQLLAFDVIIVVCGISGFLIINQITRQKKQLEETVEEKEFLLKEVNHRVKNNLNMINGLLNLHSSKIVSSEDREVFINCENQIQTISRLHERLYLSGNFREVDLHDFMTDLISYHKKSADSLEQKILFRISIDEIIMNTGQTITLALIINELLTNSIKHAFRNPADGEISITMSKDDENHITCIYTDNGPGFADVSVSSRSMGLSLVTALSAQIEGKTEFAHDKGICFKLVFPMDLQNPQSEKPKKTST